MLKVESKGDHCVLRLEGRFLTGTDPDLLRACADEVKSLNCKRLLVDCRHMIQIGSTAIGFLVGLYTSVTQGAQGRYVLVGLQPRVREVLDLTRLSTILPITSDIDSGLAYLREEAAQSAAQEPRV